jgi:putative transposase
MVSFQRNQVICLSGFSTEQHHFKALPKRWIVERTFAWLETNRRNAKHFERLNETAEAMLQLSAIPIMLNRF